MYIDDKFEDIRIYNIQEPSARCRARFVPGYIRAWKKNPITKLMRRPHAKGFQIEAKHVVETLRQHVPKRRGVQNDTNGAKKKASTI